MSLFTIIISLCSFSVSNDYGRDSRNQCINDFIRCAESNRLDWTRNFSEQWTSQNTVRSFHNRCFNKIVNDRNDRNDRY